MAKKYYVVWKGRQPSVFNSWLACQRSVDKFPGARFKSFLTLAEAEAAFDKGAPASGRYVSGNYTGAGQVTHKHPKPAEPSTAEFQLQVYCDGACEPNPGEAGSGVAVYREGKLNGLWYGLYNPQGTNNIAELNALHQALLIARQGIEQGLSVQVLCDSMYALNCISKWAKGWQAKGWKKSGGEIKNLVLIQQIYALYVTMEGKFTLSHVKAHAGTEGNELADRMSIVAVEQRETAFIEMPKPLDIEALLSLRAG
ncbi:MAG: ribonuclease H family protein [Marinobacterium sp.]|nr:ribonuclease H family protein [Marinobacterium sp.]